MKIAVPYENGTIFQHFGKAGQFKLYEIDEAGGRILSSRVASADGFGHESLVLWLRLNAVSAVVCGGIGPSALNALTGAGLKLYSGVTGPADEAINALLAGSLEYQSGANCTIHRDRATGCNCENCRS